MKKALLLGLLLLQLLQPVKSREQEMALPFPLDTRYEIARSVLLGLGWSPSPRSNEWIGFTAERIKKERWPEVLNCSAGGSCIFTWTNQGRSIKVFTFGDHFLVKAAEMERPKSNPMEAISIKDYSLFFKVLKESYSPLNRNLQTDFFETKLGSAFLDCVSIDGNLDLRRVEGDSSSQSNLILVALSKRGHYFAALYEFRSEIRQVRRIAASVDGDTQHSGINVALLLEGIFGGRCAAGILPDIYEGLRYIQQLKNSLRFRER